MDDGPDGLAATLARAALPFTACRTYSMAMVQSLDHYWTPKEVRALPDDGAIIKELVLAVDLLSPSTARFDRGLKRQFYLRSPTDELWIVDIESRVIERWRAGDERPEIFMDRLVWHPKGAVQPLVIMFDEFFAAVHGENR